MSDNKQPDAYQIAVGGLTLAALFGGLWFMRRFDLTFGEAVLSAGLVIGGVMISGLALALFIRSRIRR